MWTEQSAARARIGLAIGCAATVGAIGALTLELLALFRGRPVDHAVALLIPAVPLLVAGQLWAILVIKRRVPRRARGGRVTLGGLSPRAVSAAVFGTVPGRVAAAIYALFVLGAVLALTAFPLLARGGPGGHSATCAYLLSNHGSTTCVSAETYRRAGAAVQRFAAGILFSFFVFHAGVAFGSRREG